MGIWFELEGNMDPKVTLNVAKLQQWQEEISSLRYVALKSGLRESLKWGKPCYDWDGKNIFILQGFKQYCAVLFFNGYLLDDPDQILVKTGENTVVGRQIRFKSQAEIDCLTPVLENYIRAACLIDEAAVKANPKPQAELNLHMEFEAALKNDPALKAAFERLTPGRQRGYAIYISQAKQTATREARIRKCSESIMQGKGLND